jgi:hypothetical protein
MLKNYNEISAFTARKSYVQECPPQQFLQTADMWTLFDFVQVNCTTTEQEIKTSFWFK